LHHSYRGDGTESSLPSRGGPAGGDRIRASGTDRTGVPNGGPNGLFQNGTGPAPGTWEQGIDDYKVLATKPGQRYRDTATGALWLYDGNQWWSYDDATLLTQKTGYTTGNGFGGAMVWSLDSDGGQATLTKALHTGLN
jgi:chitinase